MIRRWRRLAAEALDRRFGPLNARIDALESQLEVQRADHAAAVERLRLQHETAVEQLIARHAEALKPVRAQLEAAAETASAVHSDVQRDVLPVLRALAWDDPGHRRRLHAVRAGADHEAAWEEAEPLVTVAIATRDRPRLLVERSLASVLAQTHQRLEVLVVGDAAGPEVAHVVAGLGDPRVRFIDLTHRVVRDDDRHWLTASTLPRNEAYRQATGRWLADLDDDDALRPEAIADLLARARADRSEVVYGVLEQHRPDGTTDLLGGFPPAFGQFGWGGAIVHAGLRFFERELVAADLGLPGDWFRCQRMLRAGVRISHLEQVTCDYYPSTLWRPDD